MAVLTVATPVASSCSCGGGVCTSAFLLTAAVGTGVSNTLEGGVPGTTPGIGVTLSVGALIGFGVQFASCCGNWCNFTV